MMQKLTTLFHTPPTRHNVTCNKKVHQLPLQKGNVFGNVLTAYLGRKDQTNKNPHTASPPQSPLLAA